MFKKTYGLNGMRNFWFAWVQDLIYYVLLAMVFEINLALYCANKLKKITTQYAALIIEIFVWNCT